MATTTTTARPLVYGDPLHFAALGAGERDLAAALLAAAEADTSPYRLAVQRRCRPHDPARWATVVGAWRARQRLTWPDAVAAAVHHALRQGVPA